MYSVLDSEIYVDTGDTCPYRCDEDFYIVPLDSGYFGWAGIGRFENYEGSSFSTPEFAAADAIHALAIASGHYDSLDGLILLSEAGLQMEYNGFRFYHDGDCVAVYMDRDCVAVLEPDFSARAVASWINNQV